MLQITQSMKAEESGREWVTHNTDKIRAGELSEVHSHPE